MALKETLKQKIEEHRPRTTRLVKEFGKGIATSAEAREILGLKQLVR